MKRALSILIVCVMLLSLFGCASEEAQLYEKYASIIDQLETQNYSGAIHEITQMAIQEQKGEIEEVPVMQLLCDTWYTSDSGNTSKPLELTFHEDGTCTIGGKSMTWLAEGEEDGNNLHVQIFDNGDYCYYLWSCASDYYAVPYLDLMNVEEMDGNMMPVSTVGSYYNHPMIPLLNNSWQAIDRNNPVSSGFWIGIESFSISNKEYKWAVVNDESQESLTIQATAKDGSSEYTMTLAMRGEYPTMTVTDSDGNDYLYYLYEYGYDSEWVEYRYVVANNYLADYLEDGSFWVSGDDTSYNDSNAIDYLYGLFTALDGYGNSAQILADWDSVLYSRAMRYLNRYLEYGSFSVGEEYYRSNAALAYVYDQFAQIQGYGDCDAILSRFTILPQMYTGAKVVTIDNLGNEGSSIYTEFEYDANGNMTYGRDPAFAETYDQTSLYFHYDENNVLYEVQYGNVSAIMTPEFDENGNVVAVTARYNSGTYYYTFEYDEEGRIVTGIINDNKDGGTDRTNIDTYTYTYEDGRLVKKVWESPWSSLHTDYKTTTYTFDENGYLIQETMVSSRLYNGTETVLYTQTITYTNDEAGRPVSASFTTDNSSDNYQSKTVTYTYEDLYFYNAED